MITIKLSATDAVSVASLINATDPKDKAAPVLTMVRIVPGLDGEFYALGTDRFIAAQYKLTGVEITGELPADGIGLTANACKFITANVKRLSKWNTPDPVEIIANPDTGEISVRHGYAVMGDTYPGGRYPVNLLSMVESWEPMEQAGPVNLGTRFLGTLGKFVDAFTKVEFWTLELGHNTSELGRQHGRPGPLRATAGNFTALIQPRIRQN